MTWTIDGQRAPKSLPMSDITLQLREHLPEPVVIESTWGDWDSAVARLDGVVGEGQ